MFAKRSGILAGWAPVGSLFDPSLLDLLRGATAIMTGCRPPGSFDQFGQRELDLIEASDWASFPPRLDWQPIFYPVFTEEYAVAIAREWNTKDKDNGNVGYVTDFDVDTDYLAAYEVREVGGRDLQEYWVPAEQLDEFNSHIVGRIEVLSEWRGSPPVRVR